MEEKLSKLVEEFEQIEARMADPDIFSNQEEFQKLLARRREIEGAVELFKKLQVQEKRLKDSEALLEDADEGIREMAKEELKQAKEAVENLSEKLKLELVPKDPKDSKNCLMELRAGTGGDEAALFCEELSRMYLRYIKERGYQVEAISESRGERGLKEVIFKVIGQGAYGRMKYESGVHRVQRIPETEAKGRVHTSAASVVVMPEVDELEIEIRDQDLRIDVYRSGGHGGQSVNTTDSAVRITHLPTDLVVVCQDEKSQLKNKIKAMGVLRSRLYALEKEKRDREMGEERQSLAATGERGDKIRTYNFPQDRVTDHRIGQNFSNLPAIMEGKIDDIIDALILEDQAKRLAAAAKD
ncbi:peptide chain release factor 1 [Candidatus Peregrinibacteria bacterium RIFCSPLOWO2_02_FULL_48_14]|nr:MAG: peptide chain release factor 1 [Candidatus Peregrinibacteria bacterium RIFCSPLOWO2_02_FULL_48_14]